MMVVSRYGAFSTSLYYSSSKVGFIICFLSRPFIFCWALPGTIFSKSLKLSNGDFKAELVFSPELDLVQSYLR